MTLQVWADFNKKTNSTIQPGTAQAVLDVKMKGDTSVLNPVFLVSGELETSLARINYVAWNGRYYWVTDTVYLTNNLAEIHCKVDVLATYKGNIAGSTFLVERSAQNYNPMLYDKAVIPAQNMSTWGSTYNTLGDSWDTTNGCFLVRVVGGGGTSPTGITTYAMNAIGLNHLMEGMFNADNYSFLSDETIKSFFNPFQYIVSVMWFPLTPQTVASGDYQHVKLGWWDSSALGSYAIVNATSVNLTTILTRPSTLPNDFRATSPQWTTMKLFLPGCGSFFLNPAEVQSDIHVDYNIDLLTGQVQVNVFGADRRYCIGTFVGQVGVPISIGQLDVNAGSTAKSLISGLGSLLSGNVGGALTGIVDTIQNVSQPTPSVNGNNGNRSALQNMPMPRLYCFVYSASDYDTLRLGRMCRKTLQLSELTGFIQCTNASIDMKGTDEERRQVNNFLNGGFYLE